MLLEKYSPGHCQHRYGHLLSIGIHLFWCNIRLVLHSDHVWYQKLALGIIKHHYLSNCNIEGSLWAPWKQIGNNQPECISRCAIPIQEAQSVESDNHQFKPLYPRFQSGSHLQKQLVLEWKHSTWYFQWHYQHLSLVHEFLQLLKVLLPQFDLQLNIMIC